MLKYLIILLDDTSTSYCHYSNTKTEKQLISLENLKEGILFSMKKNLMVQFVYPSYDIPAEYKELIETIDHVKILPATSENLNRSGVIVFNSCKEFSTQIIEENKDNIFILRATKTALFNNCKDLSKHIGNIIRLNIIITDIETFTDDDFITYKKWLSELKASVSEIYKSGKVPQINLLTDRILLENMNNCNAGSENITLAPNGKFYICPGFYSDDKNDTVGNLKGGLDINNPQLYKIAHAPLCRTCDAYHCKRCVWLNRKTTLEVNTPSHEQCVTSHLERNNSKDFLEELKPVGYFENTEIPAIDYLDPFEIRETF